VTVERRGIISGCNADQSVLLLLLFFSKKITWREGGREGEIKGGE
jgi:hypothetical protein